MLLIKNGMFLKCIQAYCHNNGKYETPVAMTTGYISWCHDNGIYLTPVAMTTGYSRYIHLWFPLILSVKVVYYIVVTWARMVCLISGA